MTLIIYVSSFDRCNTGLHGLPPGCVRYLSASVQLTSQYYPLTSQVLGADNTVWWVSLKTYMKMVSFPALRSIQDATPHVGRGFGLDIALHGFCIAIYQIRRIIAEGDIKHEFFRTGRSVMCLKRQPHWGRENMDLDSRSVVDRRS